LIFKTRSATTDPLFFNNGFKRKLILGRYAIKRTLKPTLLFPFAFYQGGPLILYGTNGTIIPSPPQSASLLQNSSYSYHIFPSPRVIITHTPNTLSHQLINAARFQVFFIFRAKTIPSLTPQFTHCIISAFLQYHNSIITKPQIHDV